jgi:hypothetical protein
VQFGYNMHEWVFQRPQNSTSPKDECYLRSLKNSRVHVYPNFTRTMLSLINNLHKNVRDNCSSFNLRVYSEHSTGKVFLAGFVLSHYTTLTAWKFHSTVYFLLVLFKVNAFPFKNKDKSHIFHAKATFTLCSAAPCMFVLFWSNLWPLLP